MTITELIEKLGAATRARTDLDQEIDKAIRPGVDPMPYRYYTHSIDHAVLVVPAGYDWCLFSDGVAGCMEIAEDGCSFADSHGATPAIALCIAALKAHATMQAAAAEMEA